MTNLVEPETYWEKRTEALEDFLEDFIPLLAENQTRVYEKAMLALFQQWKERVKTIEYEEADTHDWVLKASFFGTDHYYCPKCKNITVGRKGVAELPIFGCVTNYGGEDE